MVAREGLGMHDSPFAWRCSEDHDHGVGVLTAFGPPPTHVPEDYVFYSPIRVRYHESEGSSKPHGSCA